jgi:hypothetical protein
MIGAGAVSFFGTYTYMAKLVGPSLKAVTFVMLWQEPRSQMLSGAAYCRCTVCS